MPPKTASDIEIRSAKLSDADAIAAFHVRIWRETYAGIAPRAALDQLDELRRLTVWRDTLSAPKAGQGTVIALPAVTLLALSVSGHPPMTSLRGGLKSNTSMSTGTSAEPALAAA